MTTNIPFHKGVRLALDYVMSHKDSYEEDPEFDEFCDKIIDALDKAKESAMKK